MKKSLNIMMAVVLAFGMMACGEKKLTKEDLQAAEATLFNENQSINKDVAPKVAEKYCRYVEQNPDDSTAAIWLYHALEINVLLNNTDKSIELGNQIVSQYPQSKWAPMSLLVMGSYVYHDMLNDTAQAHAMFQRIIDEYPESEVVDDAKQSIKYLGLTPEEIMTLMLMSQMKEEEPIDIGGGDGE